MKKNFIALLLVVLPCVVTAQTYNIDDLTKGSSSSTLVKTVTGVASESKEAAKRHGSAFEEENEIKRRVANERLKQTTAERAVGNGNRYYNCKFICRTSGLMNDSTSEIKISVKADEGWDARRQAEGEAESMCRKIKGSGQAVPWHKGESMYFSGMSCEEKR